MKKLFLITILSALANWSAHALDWTYSTNLFGTLNAITNVYLGTNSTDTNRDNYQVAWNKLNHNDLWLAARFDNYIATNPAPGLNGIYYPSNTWNLNAITNNMGNFGFWVGSSNGQALVTLSLSNGVVRYVQSLK